MSTTIPPNSNDTDRLTRYRERAALARREANRATGEARDSFLFLADQWERLAELTQKNDTASGRVS